jgi:hypothetical protein
MWVVENGARLTSAVVRLEEDEEEEVIMGV